MLLKRSFCKLWIKNSGTAVYGSSRKLLELNYNVILETIFLKSRNIVKNACKKLFWEI